ncbi:putative mutator protein mutT [Alkalihalophilus pseudofirmus OF4]|uniref:8-oxo-dGTP diphosphatase n=1 Tax=Alkalihalophilus pseudofirmus (strain ATCC BAA-2126 / JCM 17055 / OF4) TaxID=398511 RepID=D3FQV3_ALKPO|nr:(deoxy)nucleoside triphosphate pyrophosphohydrolase [Alkalihalophilus pseudofirmus]ADC51473.1 putative mutator protein mutT [Alkalihalophilus pseudofirmus OF4]
MKKNIHVVGAVIFEDNKILCAKRGGEKALPHLWEFPGGKIEKGESPADALKRELLEEMKCKIDVHEQIEYTIYEYDFGVVHLTTFRCNLIEEKPVLTEHIDMKWLTPNELHQLEWAPADIPAIEKIESLYV